MKTVLITGGSRGIGAACAEVFAKNGYFTVINYSRSEQRAEELSEKIKAEGGACMTVRADITDRESVRRMISLCVCHGGGIDALINNAGIDFYGTFEQTDPQIWDKLIQTNLTGVYNVTYAALSEIKNSPSGKIVNISSVWGTYGASCEVAYSASKAAVTGFTKALARELGPSGVTVNCIAPGYIDTEMNARFDENAVNDIIYRTPLCRKGTAYDVANAALFLCSDAASFITGQVLGVDGGFI